MENKEYKYVERLCDPYLFQEQLSVEAEYGDRKVLFCANDLDALLFARSRLTDAQLAALSSQMSQNSSVFDQLSDEDKVKYLSSRYSQNFASVDKFRQFLVSNLNSLEKDILESAALKEAVSEKPDVGVQKEIVENV